MNKYILAAMIMVMGAFTSADLYAQDKAAQNDSIANAVKLKSLKAKKEKIQKEIKIQDSKRNKIIPGVASNTMEQINDKQDSICLALRSDMVNVSLEINENTPKTTPPELINQYNTLMNKQNAGKSKPKK